jgi:V/A-type H+-transporting ATPase subunit E
MEKIQELTEKIYREGVEKGQAEADRIVQEAKEQAAQIIAEAKKKAADIEAAGKKAVVEMEANTKNELKLFTAQSLSALKSEIANVLTASTMGQAVDKLVSDKDFLCKFTVALASKWAENEPIVIESADADTLKAYFAKEAKAVLDKGVTIEKVNGRNALFTIQPEDGSYKVSFGKEEFEDYFKSFLRPQLVQMLF